jgi:hypothetical protein
MAALPAVHQMDEAPGMIATVAQVDAWMERAKAGDVFVYVTGTCLPIRSSGAARMRELSSMRLVDLSQKRLVPGRPTHNYRAQRTSKPSALTRPERPMLTLPSAALVDGEAAIVDALLPVLTRFAKAGRPCPTDAQLAERTGLARDAVPSAMEAMVAANLIRVHLAPRPTLRRVLILSTGAMTGLARA